MDSANPVLVIFAHPQRQRSRINRALLEAIRDLKGLTLVDLYEEYPDFLINVPREQKRLREHKLLIFQHPFYWYSSPPLLKEWLDTVLEYGFAYGEGGTALRGLDFLHVISTGAASSAYQASGYHGFTVTELLRPFEATALLCGWRYHQPLLLQGATSLTEADLQKAASSYRDLLARYIREGRPSLGQRPLVSTSLVGVDKDG